jgi:hypothetical protein
MVIRETVGGEARKAGFDAPFEHFVAPHVSDCHICGWDENGLWHGLPIALTSRALFRRLLDIANNGFAP